MRSRKYARPARLRRWKNDQGQALVEFMIVFPLLVLLIFGIIEMGAAWRTYQVTTNAAREGARLTVLPNADEADVRAAIANRLVNGGLDPASATVAFNCSGSCFGSGRSTGEGAEVEIAYPFDFVLLGPIAEYVGGDGSAYGRVTMRSGFVMRIE